MQQNNIILIGMPGSGKSTVGVVLAKVLGYQFLDTDLVIQDTTGLLLHEIISEKGIQEFIRIEEQINSEVQTESTVIAPGGSVIYGPKAMEHFKEIGTVCYLKLEYDDLETRLQSLQDRGVVLKDGQTLKDLYLERTPLYEKYADVIVDEKDLDVAGVVSAVERAVSK